MPPPEQCAVPQPHMARILWLATGALLTFGAVTTACSDSTGPSPIDKVVVTPGTATLTSIGETVQLAASVLDADGNPVSGAAVTWTSSDESVATVSASGLVTATGNGAATVTGMTEGATGSASVTVTQTVARVVVEPRTAMLSSLGDTMRLSASAHDLMGTLMIGKTFVWSAIGGAEVDSTGLVTAVANGTATVAARTDGITGTAAIIVRQVPADIVITVQPTEALGGVRIWPPMEVTLEDARGNRVVDGTDPVTVAMATNPNGSTLLGTTTVNAVNGVAVFADVALEKVGAGYGLEASTGGLPSKTSALFDVVAVATISAGGSHTCATATSGTAYCWGLGASGALGDGYVVTRVLPVKVAGAHRFTSISASGTGSFTCGVTTNGTAYCWGLNRAGQLGDGTTNDSHTPIAVAGGHAFGVVSAGGNHGQPAYSHTCGVATDGVAYCWGYNAQGQLGDGTTSDSPTPVVVSGGYAFQTVSGGGYHSCGMTGGETVRCWGGGTYFDGTTLYPFTLVDAGTYHNCGIRSDGTAFCWGGNHFGQLGLGTTGIQGSGEVVGGQTFISISAGGAANGHHSCGVTPSGDVWCWGSNRSGQLGGTSTDFCGSSECSAAPIAVSGGHSFVSVSAGGNHSCGITMSGFAYCWGDNGNGQLGDGTRIDRSAPSRVGGY